MSASHLLRKPQDAELLNYNNATYNNSKASNRLQSTQKSAKLYIRNNCCHSFLVFFAGSIAALIFYELTHTGYLNNLIIRARSKQTLQYLPAEQVFAAHDDATHFAHLKDARELIKEFGTAVANSRQVKQGDSNANSETNIKEALSALRLAQEMRIGGKDDKAQRLFEHAYALAPRHPEILLRYGEYLEQNQRNILLADQYYYQALTINPSSSEALAKRQRTAAIVQSIDDRRLQALDEKRDALSAVPESHAALRRAKKEAYFQHIYHSVGIEGNTMTLSQTRQILETRMAIDGKSIDEHNEILGLDAAMKFINASLVNKIDITIKDILEIHRRVLGHVDPIEGGELRRTQVYVGGHIPPGPGDLSILMKSFELWLNSDQKMSLHPVQHAALAHYKLVHIHPFIDGNGRTSRVLMNTLLMRAGYPPVIIPKQQRHIYYQLLQVANEGDVRPFVRFIADCTEKTLDLYLWATSDLPQQIPMLVATEHQLANVDKILLKPTTTTTAPETINTIDAQSLLQTNAGGIP